MSQDSCDDDDKSASPPQTIVKIPESNRPQDVVDEDKKPAKFFSLRKLTYLNVTFNGILAVTTVILVISAIYQSCVLKEQSVAMLESNSINREALVSVQRAFVTATNQHHIDRLTNPSGKQVLSYRFMINWENSGVTPTRDAVHHVNWQAMLEALPKDFKFTDLGSTENVPLVLGPKASIGSSPLNIDTGTMKLVQARRVHLYIWGWLTYRDIFENTKEHITMFCRELTDINGDLDTPTGNVKFLFTTCPYHNCTDEECERQAKKQPVPRPVT